MYMHVVPSAAVSDTPQPQVTQTQYSVSQQSAAFTFLAQILINPFNQQGVQFN